MEREGCTQMFHWIDSVDIRCEAHTEWCWDRDPSPDSPDSVAE
jgi:hypothetical protein